MRVNEQFRAARLAFDASLPKPEPLPAVGRVVWNRPETHRLHDVKKGWLFGRPNGQVPNPPAHVGKGMWVYFVTTTGERLICNPWQMKPLDDSPARPALFNVTFVPVGEDGSDGGTANYGLHGANMADAIRRAVRSEVKNRWTIQAALTAGKVAILRELQSVEIKPYCHAS
jgi:hypothetical protein